MFCFTMAPVFPTSAAFCSWAIWADHSAAFLGRADYLYVPVVPPVVLHLVSELQQKARVGHQTTYHSLLAL